MLGGSGTARPQEFPVPVPDRYLVDAGMARVHQPVRSKLPQLVAVAAKPVARRVVPLVAEANGHAVLAKAPQLLDEAIVVLDRPFAREKGHDLLAPLDELAAISPPAVR